MHSKLLKLTKWGIGRAIGDSKRTALLDAFGFWVDDYSLRVIVTHGVGDPSIHKRHFLALLIGLRLAWLALMTSFLYSMYKKALVGLFRVVWEALRPRKFSIVIISFHTHILIVLNWLLLFVVTFLDVAKLLHHADRRHRLCRSFYLLGQM